MFSYSFDTRISDLLLEQSYSDRTFTDVHPDTYLNVESSKTNYFLIVNARSMYYLVLIIDEKEKHLGKYADFMYQGSPMAKDS